MRWRTDSSQPRTTSGYRLWALGLEITSRLLKSKFLCVLCVLCGGAFSAAQRAPAPFTVEETTISRIHEAMRARQLTCRALVDAYLKRIDAYDKRGPSLNAIVMVNPNATREADDLDRRFAQGGPVGP